MTQNALIYILIYKMNAFKMNAFIYYMHEFSIFLILMYCKLFCLLAYSLL